MIDIEKLRGLLAKADIGPLVFEPHGAFGSDFLGEEWPFGYISADTPRSPVFEIKPILEIPAAKLLAIAQLLIAASNEIPDMLSELERKTNALEEIVSRCPANTAAVKIATAALKGENNER